MKNKAHRVILIFVGISSIAFALPGFFFNLSLLNASDPDTIARVNKDVFVQVFKVMVIIGMVFFSCLIVTGIQLIRGRLFWANILTFTAIAEILYGFTVSQLCANPTYGAEISAAAGLANNALFLQFLTLFVFWGPALALFTKFSPSD